MLVGGRLLAAISVGERMKKDSMVPPMKARWVLPSSPIMAKPSTRRTVLLAPSMPRRYRDVMRWRSPVCTFSTSATTSSSRSANELSRQPKWICALLERSAQRRNARSSTICGTLLGISGVGQSEYGRGRRPNSWPQKRVT